MIDVKELNVEYLQSIKIPSIRTNKKASNKKNIEYLNIESAFDIETTSVKIQDKKAGFMYIWAWGIGYGNNVIIVTGKQIGRAHV